MSIIRFGSRQRYKIFESKERSSLWRLLLDTSIVFYFLKDSDFPRSLLVIFRKNGGEFLLDRSCERFCQVNFVRMGAKKRRELWEMAI